MVWVKIWKISTKNVKFFNCSPFGSKKNCLGSGRKVPGSKPGWHLIYCGSKSKLRSGRVRAHLYKWGKQSLQNRLVLMNDLVEPWPRRELRGMTKSESWWRNKKIRFRFTSSWLPFTSKCSLFLLRYYDKYKLIDEKSFWHKNFSSQLIYSQTLPLYTFDSPSKLVLRFSLTNLPNFSSGKVFEVIHPFRANLTSFVFFRLTEELQVNSCFSDLIFKQD